MSTLLQEIEAQIAGVKTSVARQNVGSVREIGDGVAKIEGLTDAMLNEMLDFGNGVTGLALNLEETEVGAIVLGDYTSVKEGQEVRTTGRLLQVPVGKGLLDDDRVRQTVQQIIAQKPRGYLAILTHFQRLVKLDVARRTARIESAIQLPESLSTAIQANLARRYGPGLAVSFAQKPDLIGGLRVQVGSDVYDGSIRARLAALAEAF